VGKIFESILPVQTRIKPLTYFWWNTAQPCQIKDQVSEKGQHQNRRPSTCQVAYTYSYPTTSS